MKEDLRQNIDIVVFFVRESRRQKEQLCLTQAFCFFIFANKKFYDRLDEGGGIKKMLFCGNIAQALVAIFGRTGMKV